MSGPIGFIGLGLMGTPMALNLIKAGYKVSVYNRSSEKSTPLREAGARVAKSPADAVAGAEFVMVIVSDSPAVEAVVTGPGGILEAVATGTIVVDSSTISPVVSRRMAELVTGKGAIWLDAPVTGSKHNAAKGELTFMVGGDKPSFDRAMPFLERLGRRHIYCGAQGSGLVVKLAQNTIQASMVEVFSETAVMVTKAGVRPDVLFELVTNSMARSPLIDFKAPLMLQGNFEPYFALKLMHKDLNLAMEFAYSQGVPMPASAVVKEMYGAAGAQGKGNMDYAAVLTLFEELTGVKVRGGGAASAA